jgi:hypothetical protein
MENKMLSLAEKLKELRDAKTSIDEEAKFVNGEIEKVIAELSDYMLESETPSFTHSGFQFSLTTRTFASAVTEENGKEQLYEALRANGYDSLFTVNAQTLSGFVKEQMEEYAEEHGESALPDWLAGKVKLYDKVSVRVCKATKSK